LDKVREQYKAQKEEEETKKKFYNSPDTMRRDDIDGEESSEGGTDSLDHSSEFTPEPSPGPQVRSTSPQAPSPQPSPLATHRIVHNPQANGVTSPYEVKGGQDVASMSKLVSSQHPGESQGGQAGGYNPYPPPTTAAPSATAIPASSASGGNSGSDKEALFVYAWYHGSIARDEALRRLESVGGFDG